MTTYYGDDTDFGDRFDADQQMAEMERIGNRWHAFETTAKHILEAHGDGAGMMAFERASQGAHPMEEAFASAKHTHVSHHLPGSGADHPHKWTTPETLARLAIKYGISSAS